jgi:hypothetical protein
MFCTIVSIWVIIFALFVNALNNNLLCYSTSVGSCYNNLHGQIVKFKTLVENPPFCNYIFNYCSTTNIVENYKNSCKLFFTTRKCFSQLQTSKVNKYKSKVSLQLKVYATCQHHNNSHYVPLLITLVENCSTNIVEGCCQLHSTNG